MIFFKKKPAYSVSVTGDRENYKVRFTIGNQGFDMPQIYIEDEDNIEHAKFMARMLVIALENLRTGNIEKSRKIAYKQFPVE